MKNLIKDIRESMATRGIEDVKELSCRERARQAVMLLPEGYLNVTVILKDIQNGRASFHVCNDVRIMGERITDPDENKRLLELVDRSIHWDESRVH